MKILMVHNFYGSVAPSGENVVFEDEKAMLQARGHIIAEFTRDSDEIRSRGMRGAVRGALATPWNPWMASAIRRTVRDFRPDVVHAHNTFPLISPAIFHAIPAGVPRVLTLHNYRLFCAAGIPMRAGSTCTDCLDRRSSLPAVRHGCYRGSRLATLPLAFSIELHRRLATWSRAVEAFIVFSEFQRGLMRDAGLPAERIHVKPNFFPGLPAVMPWSDRESYVLFAGRLSAEKGVLTLARAWRLWGAAAPELRVAGDGPLLESMQALTSGLPVRYLGQLSATDAQDQIAGARLLVLPSECFEGFPMVIREALAFGTPVAVSRLGPLPSIVRSGISGLSFDAGNPQSLFSELANAWRAPGLLERLGRGARAEFAEKYTEQANYDELMEIYGRAIAVSAPQPHAGGE